MNIVEVGVKLEKNIDYYDNLLKEKGFINDFNCVTHDIYYTNKKLDGLTENQMKNSCIRFRNKLSIIDKIKMCLKGNKKIFDTIKEDHHYSRRDLKSKIQLQEIKDIGLVVYYDNPDYYDLSLEELLDASGYGEITIWLSNDEYQNKSTRDLKNIIKEARAFKYDILDWDEKKRNEAMNIMRELGTMKLNLKLLKENPKRDYTLDNIMQLMILII